MIKYGRDWKVEDANHAYAERIRNNSHFCRSLRIATILRQHNIFSFYNPHVKTFLCPRDAPWEGNVPRNSCVLEFRIILFEIIFKTWPLLVPLSAPSAWGRALKSKKD